MVDVTRIEELKKRGELVVEAPLEVLREAAKITLGVSVKEIREDNKIIFTYDSPVCPPRIILTEIEPGKYHVISSNKCSIPDCPYWESCARSDTERLRIFEIVIKKLLGEKKILESRYEWLPERVREEELEKLIDRMIRRPKPEEL
ncbi:MAG: hypothetical protein DRJ26_04000 [Candidatus Methanomethylicota archaeon]|uniref:Uncharacterized protein n=1 Tax=Thermoproteota archaeon TaxID=2056631 RepID=A0A497EZG3_9CREN|nr:MAG: hypothetical protein DRJ20_00805 [Candidatus Verstraetearchaeota archaeon]RLE52980.1 MAG: hypothetical protein DRJ26_04000 [Candidatus Verstraetearchaeota archaeon]